MKYISLDYGARKSGLAVSDDLGTVAVPWKIVATDELLGELTEMLKNEKFKALVVGESVDSSGNYNPIFKEVEKFVKEVEAAYVDRVESGDLQIFLEKEFFSSKHARSGDGKREVDDRAATLVLQRYLDRLNNRKDRANFKDLEDEEEDEYSQDA
jgi:putative Holliday junction resolvase